MYHVLLPIFKLRIETVIAITFITLLVDTAHDRPYLSMYARFDVYKYTMYLYKLRLYSRSKTKSQK